MNSTDVTKGFTEQFGKQAEHTFFAPGRINLIGEHTDYNGGHVFPCAISLGTYAAVGQMMTMRSVCIRPISLKWVLLTFRSLIFSRTSAVCGRIIFREWRGS